MMTMMKMDKKYDILYISFADRSNSYGDEIEDGVVVMKDMATDAVTGITIFDFAKRYNSHTLSQLNLPFSIDFSNAIEELHCNT